MCPGQSCQSANGGDVCIAQISSSACAASGGIWRTDILSAGVCYYNLFSQDLCLAKGAKYYVNTDGLLIHHISTFAYTYNSHVMVYLLINATSATTELDSVL